MRKEIQVHVTSSAEIQEADQYRLQDFSSEGGDAKQLAADREHEREQIKLQRYLRTQLKSSAEAAIILDQTRYLQGIPFTRKELKAEKGKIWSKLFFASLLLFLSFQFIGKYYRLGVPTFKKNSSIWLGDEYFEQFFMRISKI